MITNEQKIILFTKFGLHPEEALTDYSIRYIQRRLTADMWVDYINELKNMLLDDIDKYGMVKKLNMQNATSYLLLMASTETKAIALSKALGVYSF